MLQLYVCVNSCKWYTTFWTDPNLIIILHMDNIIDVRLLLYLSKCFAYRHSWDKILYQLQKLFINVHSSHHQQFHSWQPKKIDRCSTADKTLKKASIMIEGKCSNGSVPLSETHPIPISRIVIHSYPMG